MTLKIDISQFYVNPIKKMKQNRHFSMGKIPIWHYFSLIPKYLNILMTFLIGIFHFHCRSEHKQVKWNKIKQDICKSDILFPNLQSIIVFEWLLRFISWKTKKLQRKNVQRFYSINIKGHWAHLAEKYPRAGVKITTIFSLSWKYFSRIIIKTF